MAGTALIWRKPSGSGQGNLGVNGFWTQVLVIWSRRTGQSWSEWCLTFRNLATGRRTSWTIASLHEKSIMDQGWQMVLSSMYNTHLCTNNMLYLQPALCKICIQSLRWWVLQRENILYYYGREIYFRVNYTWIDHWSLIKLNQAAWWFLYLVICGSHCLTAWRVWRKKSRGSR